MRARRLILAGAIAALWALWTAVSAQACSCARLDPGEALRRADAAIVGRLLAVVPRGDLRADYRYEVKRVYAGGGRIRRGEVVSVRSPRRPSACALPRRVGRSYGLFLSREAGRWIGGLCGVVEPRRLRRAAERALSWRSLSRASIGGCGG